MRKAFDSDDYQVMLVANKFQTGFDQPKLCAMYVDKKLGGVDCVQTLSRLNRTYAGKSVSGTFVLDFFNDPEDILEAFQPYYKNATLDDVSDPDSVFDLYEKLCAGGIFDWPEVEQFAIAFYAKNKSGAAVSNICKPAVERWQKRYKEAKEQAANAKMLLERSNATGDAVLIANAETDYKGYKVEQDALELFKKDLTTFTRQYEFMSQIVDYDDKALEKLSLYARHLQPMLREKLDDDDDVDLSNIVMSHYRLSKLRQQDLKLQEESIDLKSGSGGGGRARDKEEDLLSQIVARLNEMFDTENLTDSDMLNYSQTIWDKIKENDIVMQQIANNPADKIMLGDYPDATLDAIFDSQEAYQEITKQLLSDSNRLAQFTRFLLDNKLSA